jgi:uncharacterized membrane protein YgcG
MFLDFFNFYIVVPVAIIFFCALQGFFGNFVRKFMQFIYNPTLLEYLVIVLVICFVLYFMTDIAYVAPSDDLTNLNKPEVNVKDTNININNPNVSVPADPLIKGLANVGVGAAIAGGMNAAASVVKSSSIPPAIKVGTVVAGGAAAGLLVTATNAANSITQNKINSSNSTSGGSSTSTGGSTGDSTTGGSTTGGSATGGSTTGGESSKTTGFTTDNTTNTSVDSSTTNMDLSILDIENNNIIDSWGIEDCVAFSVSTNSDSVYVLLNSNFLLHIIILYLLSNLIILLLADLAIKYNWNFLFIKNIFGGRFYNLVIKGINYISRLNKIWIWIILILLVILSIGCLSISYFILNNIDIISDIV